MTVERVEILEAPVVLALADGTEHCAADEAWLLALVQEHGPDFAVRSGRFRMTATLRWTEEDGARYHERCVYDCAPDREPVVYTDYPYLPYLYRVLSFACEGAVFRSAKALEHYLTRFVADGSRFVLEGSTWIPQLLRLEESALDRVGDELARALVSGSFTLHLMHVQSGETRALIVEPERYTVKPTAILPVMA